MANYERITKEETARLANPGATGQSVTPKHAPVGTRDQAIQRMAAELGRARNDNGYKFSILMVEFDGLSLETNRLGDAFGDDVLQAVTGILIEDLGAQEFCGRLGSEDFLVICPGKGEQECGDLVESLGRKWMLGASAHPHEAAIDVTIGVASFPAQGATMKELLVAVDEARHTLRAEPIVPQHGTENVTGAGMGERRPGGIGLFAHRGGTIAKA